MIKRTKLTEISSLVELLDNDKNSEEGIDVSKLFAGSSDEINWKCKNNHTFREKVSVVYRRKNKCFYCTGRQVWSGENDLQKLYPEFAEEFDSAKNGVTPDHISPKDTKSYWWTCSYHHPSFSQSVMHRVSRKTKCPYCTGRKAVTGVNDLKTLYPEVAEEWDYKKNEGILPETVPAYIYNSYWWICPKGHSYRKKVIKRTKYHTAVDCPKCVKAYSTSFPEQAIFYYAKKCFPDAINRYKEPFNNGMELDIYIPFYKTGIEYDGLAFHNDEAQHVREKNKYLACKQLGIKLVRIKESKETWEDTADDIFYVSKRMKDTELSSFLRFLFGSLFPFSLNIFKSDDKKEGCLSPGYGFPTDFNVSRDRAEIMEYLVDIEHSFGAEHPELAEMWSKEANGKLTPFMFPSGSNYEAVWKCPKCGNTWPSPIGSIVARNVKSCRVCSMKDNGSTITKRKAEKNGSLAERSELLLKQWDYEANGSLTPYEIPLNYSFDVAWKCDKCGYKWSSSPNSRVRVNKISGCPHCTGRVAMPGIDDLETKYPKIAKEWDYENNNGVLPSQIKPFSNQRYYWRCPECGNSYPAYPGNRIKGSGCPKCAHKRTGEKNAKTVGQFDRNGQLIKTYQGLHDAAKAMNVCPNAIFQAVKNGGKSKGYCWHYLLDESS